MAHTHLFSRGAEAARYREGTRPGGVWSVLVMVGATAAAIDSPLRIVLGREAFAQFFLLDTFITLLFTADIAFHLWETRRSHIPYGRFLQATDVLAALPLQMIFGWAPLALLRIFKLARVAQAMSIWRQHHIQLWNTLRLVYFIYWLALSVHWLSSGWLALRGVPPGADEWGAYLRSLYWCISTLTTIGYGDITPHTNAQVIYAMVVMIFGVGMYGYVIANISTIITNLQPARTRYLANMEKLGAFMRSRKIPQAMQRRIRDYYGYVWEQRLGYDEASIVQGLPPGLLVEVSLFLKRDIIEKVPFFKGASEDLVKDIALAMQPVVYTPGDVVVRAGEPGADMYFISRGTMEVIAPNGSSVVAMLRDGEFFGEMALLRDQPRLADVRATSYCDVYRLDKKSFDKVMAKFPEFAAHVRSIDSERMEQSREHS